MGHKTHGKYVFTGSQKYKLKTATDARFETGTETINAENFSLIKAVKKIRSVAIAPKPEGTKRLGERFS